MVNLLLMNYLMVMIMVKCGYFKYEEFINPFSVRYTCKYFGYSSPTEMCLCSGCVIDNKGIPHNNELEEDDEYDL